MPEPGVIPQVSHMTSLTHVATETDPSTALIKPLLHTIMFESFEFESS